jgi:hypothetical protein
VLGLGSSAAAMACVGVGMEMLRVFVGYVLIDCLYDTAFLLVY